MCKHVYIYHINIRLLLLLVIQELVPNLEGKNSGITSASCITISVKSNYRHFRDVTKLLSIPTGITNSYWC